jgi:hypothetical protein
MLPTIPSRRTRLENLKNVCVNVSDPGQDAYMEIGIVGILIIILIVLAIIFLARRT